MNAFSVAIDYFQRGGVCMWPLLLCSLCVIIIGIERFLFYRKSISPTSFIISCSKLLNDMEFDKANELASKTTGGAAFIVSGLLDDRGWLGKRFASSVYARADRSIDSLKEYLNFLSVVIGLSPMLGLLGTITGMMASFNALNERTQNPIGVTAGIGEALITTVFGLSIAIVGMCIHAWLSAKVRRATLDMDEVTGAMIEAAEAESERKEN